MSDLFDFTAADRSFGLRFDRGRMTDGVCYYVRRFNRRDVTYADGTPCWHEGVVVGVLYQAGPLGASCWVIRDADGNLLVSAADGIGGGACTTRDEAVTVLGWKLEGRRR